MKIMKFMSCLLLPITILCNNITYSYENILGEGKELISGELFPGGAPVIVYTKPSDSLNTIIKNVHIDILDGPNDNNVVSVEAKNGTYSVLDNPELMVPWCNIGLMEYNGKLYIANYKRVNDEILWYIGEKVINSSITALIGDYFCICIGSTPVF